MIHLHQFRDAGGLGGGLDVEAVGLHDGAVVLLVRLTKLRGHSYLIVEVGKAAIRVQGAGIQNGLCGLLNLTYLKY